MQSRFHALDHWLGHFVPCSAHTITIDTRVTSADGRYSAQDWGAVYAAKPQWASNDEWLRWVLMNEAHKLRAATWLLHTFDFSTVRSMVELGGGTLIAAAMIKLAHPAIDYHATDFDPDFADRTKDVPWLQAVRRTTHDARNGAIPAGESTPDLVFAIGVEYALTEPELTALFRSTTAPILLCSASLVGPLASLWNKRSSKGLKRNGWPRSIAKLMTLGTEAGRSAKLLGTMPEHAAILYE